MALFTAFENGYIKDGLLQVALVVKNMPVSAGDLGLIPRLGRSPGGEHGDPLQYSCLENPLDRGAWWAMIKTIIKNGQELEQKPY